MNELTPKGQIIQGFKIVNEDLTCRDFQFQIGVWHEHEGQVKLCESGFHFCEHPSGPWTYYHKGRMFKIEAEEVLLGTDSGADLKHVARRIRLVEEIFAGGYQNTGNQNTGNWNAGDQNTGDQNTGHRNTGNRNTGRWNAGNQNTGNQNTGNRNTGRQNTGNWNAGDRNTGDLNTGDRNTGDRNTGIGNVGDGHSGDLCYNKPKYFIFNKEANRDDVDSHLLNRLAEKLSSDEDFSCDEFLTLPNASVSVIKELHEAHKAARKVKK